jgi:hypothetical protein
MCFTWYAQHHALAKLIPADLEFALDDVFFKCVCWFAPPCYLSHCARRVLLRLPAACLRVHCCWSFALFVDMCCTASHGEASLPGRAVSCDACVWFFFFWFSSPVLLVFLGCVHSTVTHAPVHAAHGRYRCSHAHVRYIIAMGKPVQAGHLRPSEFCRMIEKYVGTAMCPRRRAFQCPPATQQSWTCTPLCVHAFVHIFNVHVCVCVCVWVRGAQLSHTVRAAADSRPV